MRCERARPAELLHLDTKKLGRFWHVGNRITRDGIHRVPRAGWQHAHVAVDDHSRLAYAEVRPTDRPGDALAFLEWALAWFRTPGIPVQAMMTDYGSAYRSGPWRRHCATRGLQQRQGGTLHPTLAAPLGLRFRLPDQCPPHAGARWLAAVV